MEFCTDSIIRLFFIILTFMYRHWGWTITLLIVSYALFKLISMLGIKIFEFSGVIQFVIFFPILFILMFAGLLFGTWIASFWSSVPFCSILEDVMIFFQNMIL